MTIKKYLGIDIDYSRDKIIPEQGYAMLTKKGFYKKEGEYSPQESFARATTCFSFGDLELAQRLYDAVSKQWFTFASPVLSNAVSHVYPPNLEFKDVREYLKENVKPEGMPISCFEGSTPVYTDSGVKPIKEILVGDKVLTHKGRFRNVEATRVSSSSDIYELQCASNTTKVKVTGNHLMLTNYGWVRVDELVKGKHLIAQSDTVESYGEDEELILHSFYNHKSYLNEGTFKAKDIPDSVTVDEDFAWALGFWFAEGSSTEAGTLKVTHGDKEPCEKWAKIMSEKFNLTGTVRNNKTWFDGEVNSVALTRTFDNIFGKGCKSKALPDNWMKVTWSKAVFSSFLEGFYLGDGFKTANTKMFELANPKLVSQFAILLMQNGFTVSVQYRKQVKYNRDKGNDVFNAVISYCEKGSYEKQSIRRGIPMQDGLKYVTIDVLEKLEGSEEIPVYDLQVEEDTSFSVGGMIAHNCFLSYIPDTREGLVNAGSETRYLSMNGGGVGLYAGMRSVDEKSTGVMSHMRTYDADAQAYKQGETRRGSYAAYLPIDHPEIMNFLEMRSPVGGDPNQKCFNLNNAINVTDDFMHKLMNEEDYELVDPKHGRTGRFLSTKEVWEKILETRKDTGEPYLNFVDTINRCIPKNVTNPAYKIVQSNLCN